MSKGFTLLELVVVATIAALLLAFWCRERPVSWTGSKPSEPCAT